MRIQWLYLPDNINKFLGNPKYTKKNNKNKKMKTTGKKNKYGKKNNIIFTTYTINQTRRILNNLRIKNFSYIKLLPRYLKTNSSIEQYLLRKNKDAKFIVLRQFKYFKQIGGSNQSYSDELDKRIKKALDMKKETDKDLDINTLTNEEINQKQIQEISLIDEYQSILKQIDNHLEEITKVNQIIKENYKNYFNKLVKPKNNMETEKEKFNEIIENIDEDTNFNLDPNKISVLVREIKKKSEDGYIEKFNKELKELKELEELKGLKVSNNNGNLKNDIKSLKNILETLESNETNKETIKKIEEFLEKYKEYITFIDNNKKVEFTNFKEHLNLYEIKRIEKKVYNDYKKQLNNKIKESIKLIDELKKKIKRFSNKNGINSKRKNKIDVTDKKCYESIEKLWYNNYNSPSLEATIEIVDGDKNELKYNNEKEKVLDFYSVLNNCSPLKNTLVAGVAIAPKSSLSQLTSRIDPPQINSIF